MLSQASCFSHTAVLPQSFQHAHAWFEVLQMHCTLGRYTCKLQVHMHLCILSTHTKKPHRHQQQPCHTLVSQHVCIQPTTHLSNTAQQKQSNLSVRHPCMQESESQVSPFLSRQDHSGTHCWAVHATFRSTRNSKCRNTDGNAPCATTTSNG
jgi:hypothetical protein